MALQKCQICGQQFAEVEHHLASGKVVRVCRSCRVGGLLMDYLGPDGTPSGRK